MVGQLLDRGTEFTQHSDELFPSAAMGGWSSNSERQVGDVTDVS
jgi:hypothetical protein